MKPVDLEFYRNVKIGFANLYTKYGLEPAGGFGLNVCIEIYGDMVKKNGHLVSNQFRLSKARFRSLNSL